MNRNTQLIAEIVVPGGHARAFEVKEGQLLEIIDVEGQQVADFFAFNEHNHWERLSPSHTFTALKSLALRVGDELRSSLRNRMLKIIKDTSPSHDLLIPACDEQRYLVDYGVTGHRSCVQNFEEALRPYGIGRDIFPAPFNFFQSTAIEPDGRLIQEPCRTKAGDSILLQAMKDIIGAVSACPMDLNPIGGSKITDIKIRVYQQT
ncbi:urea carboxylase-associated family protein [Pusillimonas sp. CC-YST705]|uniref:Urea carboxylase-associated family protein n=1 Tax=Mesopusillimonas faecipullorum TaxID=2755040 RepID=A0ABS8CET9_9BURK|nr:urea carboxylase-associated family protein [Mesopusillimonas faecipullorum]MCB5364352.1 urea carboxylase-associated family protein [Mesopusillimonas faecipullorum]